ncbi:MAG: B12-binding domain-containing radical SAM protein [Candidatus Thorarchaeota archaeon]
MKPKYIDFMMVFPSGGDVSRQYFSYHLGASYIISFLREKGFRSEQFISNESYNAKECAKKIMGSNPKVIGFTVYETNYMQSTLISNEIKKYNRNAIIIFGGPTPTVQSKVILENLESVDICVRQEGEETILELLTRLNNNNFNLNQLDLNKIKGISFRNKNQIVENPDCSVLVSNNSIKNYIDKYPSPYITKVIPAAKAFPTGIITARGCNQNCIYCNCAAMSKRNIYTHSVERVIEELSFLSECKKFLKAVPIYDDAFTILPERAREICETIIKDKIKIPLICTTRCDTISEELLDLLKKAGFISVGFSLESVIPRILNIIGKVRPPADNSENFQKEKDFINKFSRMVAYAKKIGIKKVFSSIMVGLPSETLQEAQKTIDFINKLDVDVYTHNNLHIYKGTPIFQNYYKYGYNVEPIGKYNQVMSRNNFPFDTTKVTIGKKCSLIQKSRMKDYNSLKKISLSIERPIMKSYFENIIINSDQINPDLIIWMQKNLMINGAIIHIYSDKNNFFKFYDKNRRILYDNLSPTLNYESYFKENLAGKSFLKSQIIAFYGEDVGIPINLERTSFSLGRYIEGKFGIDYLICQECEVKDTNSLLDFLLMISKLRKPFKYLMKRNPLPQFQKLCRWTENQANCKKLETIIVGPDDLFRICYNSKPIGKLGDSFQEIKQNIVNLEYKIQESRGCSNCFKYQKCLKCAFPYPISSEEYCDFKKSFDTINPSSIINGLNLMKDLLYKPIEFLDY